LEEENYNRKLQESEADLKYPNIHWAIERRRLRQFELASNLKMDPSRLSRCLTGRSDFAPHERKRISQILGFKEDWLFCEPVPVPLTDNKAPRIMAAHVGGNGTSEPSRPA
jgi:hypothetical protein